MPPGALAPYTIRYDSSSRRSADPYPDEIDKINYLNFESIATQDEEIVNTTGLKVIEDLEREAVASSRIRIGAFFKIARAIARKITIASHTAQSKFA